MAAASRRLHCPSPICLGCSTPSPHVPADVPERVHPQRGLEAETVILGSEPKPSQTG